MKEKKQSFPGNYRRDGKSAEISECNIDLYPCRIIEPYEKNNLLGLDKALRYVLFWYAVIA